MRGRVVSAVGAVACLLAAPVLADHFSSIDLGQVPDLQSCLTQADTVFGIYAGTFGTTAEVSQGSWTITAWDLPPANSDVTILCVEVGGVWNAFATGHVHGDGQTPESTVVQIRDLFSK